MRPVFGSFVTTDHKRVEQRPDGTLAMASWGEAPPIEEAPDMFYLYQGCALFVGRMTEAELRNTPDAARDRAVALAIKEVVFTDKMPKITVS